ncbi:hypothetical protein C2845_PM06G00920 [Panicum miliaceum]|uniref:Polygalacturonase n=1 Tax=Panicum miliaceum TaxID=4540 RepID=A0A3L6R924_PANMI|nr:hypothetical protein C2845_PM06G00920 [Panicum miliaceum]
MARAAPRPAVLMVAAVVAVLLPDAAEPRILLTLDDFGAVGDGVADDTKVRQRCCSVFNIISRTRRSPGSSSYLYHDLKVTGGGIIDGRGQQWWARSSCEEKKNCTAQPAPKAVHFEDCHGISVKGITLQNSQQYHLTFTRSSNVEANYLRVTSPEDSIDTKGMHLVDSKNVHVMDNLISTGDDCVSIMGNCTDVRLRAISCGPGHGISIGTLGVNGSVDYVEKIKVDTLFISNAENGVRVKTTKVKFESIVMRNVTNPIIIDQGNSDDPADSSEAPQTAATAVQVEKINYIDIRGTSASEHAVTFSCSDAKPCRHLSLTNVNLTWVDGLKASSYCRKAFGKSTGTVIPESCLSKEDFVHHVPRHSEEDEEEDSDS